MSPAEQNHDDATAQQPKPKLRWFHLTPDRLVVALLVAEGFLLLSERFSWFGFGQPEGRAALIALAAVGLTLLLMLLWFTAALLFRWRFQYSLRSLLLLVVAVAIPCSWLTVTIQNQRKQTAAAEAIEKAWGKVKSEPTWLGKLLRDDSLVKVTGVDFPLGTSITTDAVMVHLQELSQLQELHLDHTGVTDAGLVHLRGLSRLQELWLQNTRVTDAGLVQLRGLKQLQFLDLSGVKVTDAGLVHLRGLSQLEVLWLIETEVTDAGLIHLEGLKQLRLLGLAINNTLMSTSTKVTDQGVKKLQQALPKCKIEH
jgi:hypothetical protein